VRSRHCSEIGPSGFTGQSWLTFRQALLLGGHVRKGERGTTVVYADRFVPKDEKRRAHEDGDEAQAIPFLNRFTVFITGIRSDLPGQISTRALPYAAYASAHQATIQLTLLGWSALVRAYA